jgi:HD-GYP domain-containing protein (c-di-GMP phosphodiesterase class II)
LGLPKKDLETLGIAALLQDLGKIKLPTELLTKVDEISRKERELLKKHVDISVLLVNSMEDISKDVVDIVALHHERFDGSGYPRRFSRTQINTLGVISGLVDSYQAMTAERPYRKPKTSFQALMELYDERDKTFPGALVEQFIQCVGIFPVGSFVELNTGEIGVVVARNRVQQLKPRVMILIDPDGEKMSQPQTVDLAAEYSIPGKKPRVITKIVEPEKYDLDPSQYFA